MNIIPVGAIALLATLLTGDAYALINFWCAGRVYLLTCLRFRVLDP